MSQNAHVFLTTMCLSVAIYIIQTYAIDKGTYLKHREAILNKERMEITGGEIALSADESKVNQILMTFKIKEIEYGKQNNLFPPAMHFFKAKPLIEKSDVFRIIKAMPKGAALHLHDVSLCDIDWLIKNASYLPHVYVCQEEGASMRLHYFDKPATDCYWTPLKDWRSKYGKDVVDQWLLGNMTLLVDDPVKAYPNIDAVWKKFLDTLGVADGLIFYAPIYKAYYYQALQEFYDDNVQYIEVRTLLSNVYELNGTIHDKEWVLKAYIDTLHQFMKDHPDFSGSKTIYSNTRFIEPSAVQDDINLSIKFRNKYPDHFAGYDLVGQEDPGFPLTYYLDQLLSPSQMSPPVDLPYFFHAGETDWYGTAVDINIIDALLLNTSRIGHGYAINKHPEALRMARESNTPIEVNPISNQVLGLVTDLRNHPASSLMGEGFPMVISSDDPGVWGARALSYDFYEAFMGLGGEFADLKTLKKLAIDSLHYSAMNLAEKQDAMRLWQKKWDMFIQSMLQEYGNLIK
ncbi:unnamed protein product [Owenia fusiformis]|uniref:adenosine deaminase n=1 Tax=Owenia fusiformis TaxID=6347 RepID=A0A8J1U151_OWEFU|nr:unnamed protein product [Owenia fusiformis]